MLNKFSLKSRFRLSLGLLWSVILLCTAIGINGLIGSQKSLELIYEDKMTTMALLQEITASFEDAGSHVFRAFQHDPSNEISRLHDHPVSLHLNAILENQKKSNDLRMKLNQRVASIDEEGLQRNFSAALDSWNNKIKLVTDSIEKQVYSNELMMVFLEARKKEGLAVQQALKALESYQIEQANVAAILAKDRLIKSVTFFALLYALLALPATVFMILSMRRLEHGLTSIEKSADAIAEGDFTYSIPISGDDEMTHVKQKIRHMQNSLSRLIEGVRQGAQYIETNIQILSNASAVLGDRNVQQSASLEQTSAATQELSGTVENNAENARQAEETAQQADQAAIRGNEVVKGVVKVMGEINESSAHIANIVSIINSIAFQTNILALNAAVEAARAGEEGRGFAVVASEVRSLAQRSASAADDIKALVEKSIQVVNTGSEQANRAGDMMNGILDSNSKLSNLISEISHASREQVIGLSQINQAMSLMEGANNQNNELAAETAVTAEGLHNQASQLLELVSVFRTHSSTKSVEEITITPAYKQIS